MISPLLSNLTSASKFLYRSLIYNINLSRQSRRYQLFSSAKISKHCQRKALNILNHQGYCVIENYFSEAQCHEISNQFINYIDACPDYLHKNQDIRGFGLETVLPLAAEFYNDKTLQCIGESALSQKLYCAFTLGNLLIAGSMGSSGDGWHRDAYFGQYKALVYLTDVDLSNGPLEIIPKTHKLIVILLLILAGKSEYNQDRYSDDSINLIIRFLGINPKAITAKAGTLVLFNATCLHRGRPIESSQRIALTNYYFPVSRNLLSVRRQFWPVIINTNSHNS